MTKRMRKSISLLLSGMIISMHVTPLFAETDSKSSTDILTLPTVDPSNVAPNILNAAFDELPTESKGAIEIAIDAFVNQTSGLEGGDDKGLGARIGDFVKQTVNDAIAKGEDWVQNGGIRDLLQKQVAKMTDGKLSAADQQHVQSMIDGLCNVNTDGGKSFVQSLGEDGVPVATSLAVNALKNQVSASLPADQADVINGLIDVLKDSSTSAELKQNAIALLQKEISEKVPYENSAKAINDILDKIANNQAVDTLESIKDLGKNIAVDALKDVLTKNIDPNVAAKINNILDGVAQGGVQGGIDAALQEVNALIDQHAPGADSAAQLKQLVADAVAGTATTADFKNTATAVVSDAAKALLDKSGLPPEIADLAKTAIDGLAENGLTGLTGNVGDYIEDYVASKLGDDAGKAVGEIFDAVVTPGKDAWGEVLKQAPTIGKAIGQKVLSEVEKVAADQINKWIAKCPTLKKIFDALGINGKGIVNGIKNVLGVLWNSKGDFSKAISTLSGMAVAGLRKMAINLVNSLLQWGLSVLFNNLIPKAVDWAAKVLKNWSDSVDNKLLKKGLDYLRKQVEKAKNTSSISIETGNVASNIVIWIESQIKKKRSGTGGGGPVLQGGSGGTVK